MKENVNIEEFFKQKFESFEGNVDPSVWANVSHGIGRGGSASGLSGLVRMVVGVVSVTGLGVWYFSTNSEQDEMVNIPISAKEEIISIEEEKMFTVDHIVAEDSDDPVIQKKENEIQNELANILMSPEDFDEDLIEMVRSHENSGNQETSFADKGTTENNDLSETVDKKGINETKNLKEERVVKSNLQLEIEENELTFISGAKDHTIVEWEFGDGLTGIGDRGSHTYRRPGTYLVKMAVHGESGTLVSKKEITIEGTSSIGKFPNIITPNGDGHNDHLLLDCEGIETFQVTVYDMNGRQIFVSNDPHFEWNGELPNGSVVEGRYFYQIYAEGEDGAFFEDGDVILVKKQ